MAEGASFQELFERLADGDDDAASEIERRFGHEVRASIRRRLRMAAVGGRPFDTMDVYQSTMGSFFCRMRDGRFSLDDPAQLRALLVKMAQNKLAFQLRKQRALRRDARRVVSLDAAEAEGQSVASRDATPSEIVALAELEQQFRARLTVEERELADERAKGQEWQSLAAAAGQAPETLRKRLARAIERVSRQLELRT